MNTSKHLFEEIISLDNLRLAHKNASKSKGHYKQIKEFNKDVENNLIAIRDMLKNKTYKDIVYHPEVRIDKGKERLLMKLDYYPHRIIQWAIMNVCEPIFTKYFCSHSCASVKNKGIVRALRLTERYLHKHPLETRYCLKIDVKQFYPSINKEILFSLLKRKFRDKDLLDLFKTIIDSYPYEKGIAIGSYLSQYLANFYLTPFDKWLKETKKIKYVVRYMDDIIILHSSKEYLHNLRKEIQQYWLDKLDLQMKNNYQVFPIEPRGIDFIGYRLYHTHTILRTRNKKSLRDKSSTISKKKRISYNDFCSVNSRLGFMSYCKHIGLYSKYIKPNIDSLISYYHLIINTIKQFFKTKRYALLLHNKQYN